MNANARVAAAAGTNDMRPSVGSNDPIRPMLVRTVTFRTAPMQTSGMAPMPALVQMPQQAPQQVAQALPQPVAPQPVAAPVAPAPALAAPQALPQPAPVQQAVALPPPMPLPNPAAPQRPVEVASAEPIPQLAAPQTVVPQTVAPKVAAVAAPVPVAAPAPAQVAPALIETASAAPAPQFQSPVQQQMQTVSAPTAAAIHAHGGWLIQIGAFDDEDQARQHLITAQVKVRTALAGTDPFTERVQKGDKALYRARFAGFDKSTAESACKELKRSDFQCMALKD